MRLALLIAAGSMNHLLAAQEAGARVSAAAGLIDGIVADTTLSAIADAAISLLGSNVVVTTGASGRFRIDRLPPGTYFVFARRIGFQPAFARVMLRSADTVRISLLLERAVTALDTVRVTTPESSPNFLDFEARRRLGEGQFMTREEIDKANTPWVSGLLERLKFVHVAALGGPNGGTVALSQRSAGPGGCPFAVMLDGIPLRPPVNLEHLPSPGEIGGIEVYLGPATIPVQYKRLGTSCGLILIWTRDR